MSGGGARRCHTFVVVLLPFPRIVLTSDHPAVAIDIARAEYWNTRDASSEPTE
jgi:hypothetical protein